MPAALLATLLATLLAAAGCAPSAGAPKVVGQDDLGPAPSTGEGPPPPAFDGTSTSVVPPTPATAPTPTPTPPTAPTTTSPPAVTPAGAYTSPVAARSSYGRTHHDYPAADIFAACGSPVVAPTAGTVTELRRVDRWDPAADSPARRGGLSFTLVGDDGVRYYGSHLMAIGEGLQAGAAVRAGTRIGSVGQSGNARSTPCHLHFGISPPCPMPEWRVRRGAVYPQPFLDSWRSGGQTSPHAAVAAWETAHPGDCQAASALPDADDG